jgi:DHA2 family multidrug resistance protein
MSNFSENHPLSGAKLALATLALGMGSFMNILDMSIANVALPTVAGDFAVSPTQGTWVITSYAVSEAIFLPLTGWLSKRFGEVRQFIFATLLFTLASMLCGLSPSFGMLIFARVLQGIVGASMIPLSQALLVKCFPKEKAGMALGIWATTTVVAPVLGPVIGGWLTDNFSWRWVFYINVPFGFICAYLVYSLFGAPKPENNKEPVDMVGIILLILGVSTLQIMLDKGSELDWFSSPLICVLGLVSFLSLSSLIIWELGESHPVIDLRLFKLRNFAISSICLALGSFAFYIYVVIGPLWMQTQLGYTALSAGHVMAFTGLLALICGPLFGANIHRIDARWIATFGFISMALGCYLAATFTMQVDMHTLIMARLIVGAGIAGFFMPMTAISMSQLKPNQIAAGTGITNFLRNLGGSVGTALSTTMWQDYSNIFHAQMIDGVRVGSMAFDQFSAQAKEIGLSGASLLAYIDYVANSQAYLLSTNHLMIFAGIVLICLMPVIWLAKPPFGAAKGGH